MTTYSLTLRDDHEAQSRSHLLDGCEHAAYLICNLASIRFGGSARTYFEESTVSAFGGLCMRKFSPAIEHVSVRSLRPYPRNARRHSKAQIKQIAASIERFGFTNPVLMAEDGEIVAGHGRVAAAMLLGIDTMPALRLSHLTEAERRAYVLADNKLASMRAGTAKCSRSSYKVWSTLCSMSNLPASLWPRSISYWTRHARAQPTVRIPRSKT